MRRAIPKSLLAALATALLCGCGVRGIPLPPSLELPTPVTDLHAVRKGDKVYLTWTVPTETTDRQTVRRPGSTAVCRSVQSVMNECGTPLAKLQTPVSPPPSPPVKNAPPMKMTGTYVDTGPLPSAALPTSEATYAVEVLNESGRSAGLSNLVLVPLFPAPPTPPNFNAEVTADGVRISWQCVPVTGGQLDDVQYRMRIYRSPENSQAFTRIDETDFSDCSKSELWDQTFEWEKTYYYRGDVVTVITRAGMPAIEIEGDDTPAVKIVAQDIFPPAAPTGLQAVASGVGQPPFVDLIWAPATAADLAGYNLYRHEEGREPVKINAELVKAPVFRDTNVAPGTKYLYSVSAVDLRGNESPRSEEASEAVP